MTDSTPTKVTAMPHPRFPRTPRTLRQRGFSLPELIVSVGIVVFMFFMLNIVFKEAGQAMRQGIGVGKVVNNAHTMAREIQRDFKRLMPPLGDAAGGPLFIIQEQTTATVPDMNKANGEITRTIRTDQIAFFRYNDVATADKDVLEPLVPTNVNSFSNSLASGDGLVTRVWYGHCVRTRPDGTSDNNPNLGDTKNDGINRIGTKWILGRHVLFLGITNTPGPKLSYLDNYRSDNTISSSLVSGTFRPFQAMADLSTQALTNTSGGIYFQNGITYAYPTTSGPLSAALSPAYYLLGASTLAFHLQVFEYPSTNFYRLRVNPTIPAGSNVESWRVAQMHPVFMTNVSDFIIEFAGDYDNDTNPSNSGATRDGNIDVTTTGEIRWYSSYPNTADGTYPIPLINPNYTQGIVESNKVPAYDQSPIYRILTPYFDANFHKIVFRHNDTKATGDAADGPGKGSRWPRLLRIRYRLHDDSGRLAGISDLDAYGGFWFEQIIHIDTDP